ncbi:MAG TPA: CoA transferase [Streptosporangiaceae bacterium]
MRMTVLGGCGGWPAAGSACSGYLVEHGGFRVLIDPGYAVLPRLLGQVPADGVDALDRPGMLDQAFTLHSFDPGDRFAAGPFEVRTWLLPHWLPNAGLRLEANGETLAYTGDCGPSPDRHPGRRGPPGAHPPMAGHLAGYGQGGGGRGVRRGYRRRRGGLGNVSMLDQAWAAVASDGTRRPDLSVTGPDDLLPSRLPVLDAAVACAGAALSGAAALRGQRGGPAIDTVELDRGHVADAFRSERNVRVNGQPMGDGFAPLSRFWRAADGWVRTHANYPWHREALLAALGTGPEDAGAAIAGREALELEQAILNAGGIAVAVRDERTWRQSEQARLLARRPLVASERIGDAPRRRLDEHRPVKVLDLTRVIAGPTGTRYLGALGADVLRLDPPHRLELPLHQVDGLLAKRSALLDAATADGIRILHDLLDGADVLVHGYRAHTLERFGLSAHALAGRHPGLVVVSLSAWGDEGPWGDRRGFDSIVQAASGIAMIESADGTTPGALPCQLLDHGTGYLIAAAAMTALAAQLREGGTQIRSLSLARTALWLLDQPRPGHGAARQATELTAKPWLGTVDGADGPVTMVNPLGSLDGTPLAWPPTLTGYGAARPAWLSPAPPV